MKNTIQKILKESEFDWVSDIINAPYFNATPEMLEVGADVIVDGDEIDDDGEVTRYWNMESGIIVAIRKFMGNDVMLIKFDNWDSDDYSIVAHSAPLWDGFEGVCKKNNCWSFMRDKNVSFLDDKLSYYIKNPNYKENLREEMVRKEFHMDLPDSVLKMNQIFKKNGHQLYVVGGAVRDALLGNEPKDFDLATDATPDKVKSMLHMYRTIDMGEQFAIVNVVTEDGQYEIATFRRDIGKGRRPDSVEFTSIDQDVLRRDLTINALFYDIDTGEVVDLVGGIGDIESNVVRTVGSASERFDEDKLRILRAFRFAARVGSQLDPDIESAIKKDKTPISGNGLSLSQERIRDEFLKGIKQAQSVGYFIQLITKYNLWDWIFGRLVVTTEPLVETRNSNVLIAILLRSNDPTLVERTLVSSLKYTVEEAREIAFLIKFYQTASDLHYKLRERFDVIKMSDDTLRMYGYLLGISSKVIDSFLKYRITTSGEELKKRGFVGKDIGIEKDRIEREKYNKLMNESEKKVSYSAVILTEESRHDLLSKFNLYHDYENKGWELLAHHMTVNLGPIKQEYKPLLGQSFDLTVTHIGSIDNVVIAVRVDTQLKTKNENPHITLAVNRGMGGKPVKANEISNWKPVTPFNVEGVLNEVYL